MSESSTMDFMLKDIPDDFINGMCHDLAQYCIPMYQGTKLLGSGTLIQVDDAFGILTARHVLSAQTPPIIFQDSITEVIQLCIDRQWHHFTLPHAALSEIVIAEPVPGKKGADLTFIRISDCEELEILKRKKGFWNLSDFTEDDHFDLSKPGLLCLTGYPAEKCGIRTDDKGNVELMSFCLGLTGFRDDIYVDEEFDYIEFTSHHGTNPDLPENYGGMSGGGLWHVNMTYGTKSKNFTYEHDSVQLCGVAFFQEHESEGVMKITGHGSQSLQLAIERIRAN
tara:strand:- start:382 stop:1224 length:843 start_codon:yes stop_codon:yes gene_type:complete